MMTNEELMNIKRDLVILLVEDNKHIRKQVSSGLAKIFDTVLTANDGEQALNILQRIYVDVVISDINMPKMSGVELIKKIRENEKKVKPIIVTTAYHDFQEVYEKMPNIHLLVKPYTMYDIIKCIDTSEELIIANQQNEDSFEKLNEVSDIAKDILKQLRRE